METIKKRSYGIDLIKFICAILVVTIHVPVFGRNPSNALFSSIDFTLRLYLGRLAVPFFFVCNGYFLFRKIDINHIDFPAIWKTVIKFIKYYIVWTIIYLPISFAISFYKNKNIVAFLIKFIKNFFLTGSYSHLWYMNAAIVAIAIIGLLLKLKVKPQAILIGSGVLYFIGLFDESYYGLLKYVSPVKTVFDAYNSVFTTTRNGIFYGLFIVSLGMIIAVKNIKYSTKKSILFFVISMLCLLAEILIVKHFSLSRDCHMYLMTGPAAYSLFTLACNINVKETKLTRKFGVTSKLVYFGHHLISDVFTILFILSSKIARLEPVKFILVLVISLCISLIIIKLSEKKGFKWLKILY